MRPLALAPRSPEGTDAEVGEHQGEGGGQDGPAKSCRSSNIAMILTHRRSSPHQRQHQEQQSSHFQPEHMQHPANAADGDFAGFVERPYPAILTALASGDAEKSAALGY